MTSRIYLPGNGKRRQATLHPFAVSLGQNDSLSDALFLGNSPGTASCRITKNSVIPAGCWRESRDVFTIVKTLGGMHAFPPPARGNDKPVVASLAGNRPVTKVLAELPLYDKYWEYM